MGVLRIVTFILISIFVGCNGEELLPSIENANFPGSGGSSFPPGRWDEARLPLDLKISDAYKVTEQDYIIDRMISWEDSINNHYDFFEDDVTLITNYDPDNLSDHLKVGANDPPEGKEMGIYYTTKYHEEFSGFTLAITYSLGYERTDNLGAYIEMFHSDIILNGRDFTFTSNPMGAEFDLESVIVHEVGHLLGMNHDSTNSETVMRPSIWFGQINRTPSAADARILRENYRLDPVITNSFSSALRANSDFKEGRQVIIMQKLKANGDCEHYINGNHQFTHMSSY